MIIKWLALLGFAAALGIGGMRLRSPTGEI
jgi:hypothetical protein